MKHFRPLMDARPQREAGRNRTDSGQTDDESAPPIAESDAQLVPEAPMHLLESTGGFACPHCGDKIRLQGVGLRFEGSDNTETVRLDLRHPEESLDDVVDDVRRVLAIRALRDANGVKVRAAEIAGMKYTTFYELVRRLGIVDDDFRS